MMQRHYYIGGVFHEFHSSYFFLGVSLATPIGPVKATLLNTGIKNGFFHAWFFGLGAIVTDILYMVMVYFGIGHFIEIPFIKTLLWSFGFSYLCTQGLKTYLHYILLRWIQNLEKWFV